MSETVRAKNTNTTDNQRAHINDFQKKDMAERQSDAQPEQQSSQPAAIDVDTLNDPFRHMGQYGHSQLYEEMTQLSSVGHIATEKSFGFRLESSQKFYRIFSRKLLHRRIVTWLSTTRLHASQGSFHGSTPRRGADTMNSHPKKVAHSIRKL